MSPITNKQRHVLEALRSACRNSAGAYNWPFPHFFQENCRRLAEGDSASAYWMGALTSELVRCTGYELPYVLRTLHALARRGLVLRETFQDRRWWPIGLADEICRELVGGAR